VIELLIKISLNIFYFKVPNMKINLVGLFLYKNEKLDYTI